MIGKIFLWIMFVGGLLSIGIIVAKQGQSKDDYGLLDLFFSVVEILMISWILFEGI